MSKRNEDQRGWIKNLEFHLIETDAKKNRLVFWAAASIFKSCLFRKILSKKVKCISVAQLVHEISVKTFQVEFSNFHNFVNFFYMILFMKRWNSKMMDLEIFASTTTFEDDKKSKIS